MTKRPSLEELVISEGLLSEEELGKARAYGQGRGLQLEKAISALQLASEKDVYKLLAQAAGMRFVDLEKSKPPASMLERIPLEQIEQNGALPVAEKAGALWVAIDDPLKTYVADNLGFVAGCEVRCVLAGPKALKRQLRRVLGDSSTDTKKSRGAVPAGAASDDPDAPIIRLVERTIAEAVLSRASDIHIEPFEGRIRVRNRIDGVLREKAVLDDALHGALISRLKIMASLDIAEKRKPQDGRIEMRVDDRAIDIRTSLLPSNHGESVVMRLLDKEKNLLSLEALGFAGEDRARFDNLIKRPNGIVLVTGPTGSGKTTTLYAALSQLNRPDTKIITAEDPVEFNIPGINQCQVKSRIGLSFAKILRAMLRQAPNIILVGEIRDKEAAEIAIQAALTGHLVFSTLHTNDAPSAITRLSDMGIKPFLVSAAIQAVMAQRLVRVLCQECKQEYQPGQTEARALGLEMSRLDGVSLYQARGCDACEQSGYRGRLGVFELMVMDAQLREMTFKGEPLRVMREYARNSAGMRTLAEDGVRKVLDGLISVDELLRVTAAV